MLRSSGARRRAWFCMRGRSVGERAIVILGAGGVRDRPRYNEDNTAIPLRYNPFDFSVAKAKMARRAPSHLP